ncbi:Hypothetical predicted protein [Paramuricea clavata]|nr:Hypothetical predicted protein [Paramuricea clavata]
MARQLAALASYPSYRYSQTPVKDSTHFGINHTLQTTPLKLNGELNIPDLSVFKTPPEGPTPVDQKQFVYDEETLKTLSFYNKQLNDSGITQQEYLDILDDDAKQCSKNNEAEAFRSNDDDAVEFYTPPDTQDENIEDPPFGYPPSSDKLINSVITLLSKTATVDTSEVCEENCLQESENIQNENELGKEDGEFFEAYEVEDSEGRENDVRSSLEKNGSTLERDSAEKDSLDGSPHSRRSFTQEEDDSGISTVDENDIVQEATMTNGGHFEAKKEQIENKTEGSFVEMNHSGNSPTQRASAKKKTCNSEPELKRFTNESDIKYTQSNESEMKYTKSNCYESEETSIGWQTRHKRMSKRRYDRESERMGYYNDTTENHRSNHKESTPRRSASKNKDRNQGKLDRSETYSKVADRHVEERSKEKNAWGNRRGEDSEIHESPKRSSRRGGQAGKKSDSKYTRNGNKEKYSDLEKHENQVQNTKPQLQASVFSYRDALLKAGSAVPSTKEQIPSQVSSKADRMFNVESAVNYLSTVWMSVNNLHRKDPSKVYIYNGDQM